MSNESKVQTATHYTPELGTEKRIQGNAASSGTIAGKYSNDEYMQKDLAGSVKTLQNINTESVRPTPGMLHKETPDPIR